MVFLLDWYNEYSCHVRTAGTHCKVVWTIAEIVMRTVASSEIDDRTVLITSPPAEKIDSRFHVTFRNICGRHEPVKQI